MDVSIIFNTILDLFIGCADFGKWLFETQTFKIMAYKITFTPIAVLGITTFLTIFTLHVAHLINPGG